MPLRRFLSAISEEEAVVIRGGPTPLSLPSLRRRFRSSGDDGAGC
jgi:hypothetical protein